MSFCGRLSLHRVTRALPSVMSSMRLQFARQYYNQYRRCVPSEDSRTVKRNCSAGVAHVSLSFENDARYFSIDVCTPGLVSANAANHLYARERSCLLTLNSCSRFPRFEGNGYCDDYNNNEECAFDGGDVRAGSQGQHTSGCMPHFTRRSFRCFLPLSPIASSSFFIWRWCFRQAGNALCLKPLTSRK